MSPFKFKVLKQSKKNKGRLGVLSTPHGDIQTPVFMPVGTQGSVKSLTPEMLLDCGAEIILSNTYHLFLRPGTEVLDSFNGIHNFINWHKPLLTDSGGFQVFSLGKINKVTEDGVKFQSHLNGESIFFTPEKVIEIQQTIGADIMMPLDECLPAGVNHKKTLESLQLTTRWAKRCQDTFHNKPSRHVQTLFGIIQGGMFPDLRKESAEQLIELDFFGYSIGGLSVGESREQMKNLLSTTVQYIPAEKPRYLMGVGTPEDLDYAIDQGVDMFDCVFPTRVARHGSVFSDSGSYSIKNKEFKFDESPLSASCSCYTCRNYSRAYVRHLWRSKELLAMTLLTIHNIKFLIDFVQKKRNSIREEN